MTKAELIKELARVLEVDDPSELMPQTELAQLETWDSTAVLNVIVLLDEHGVAVDEQAVPDCMTVSDLMDLARDVLTD